MLLFTYSKEFRIYSKIDKSIAKSINNEPEMLMDETRNRVTDKPIKQAENAEIDYKNLTVVESAILSELVNFIKHSYKSLVEVLQPNYSEHEICQTLKDMENRGWIE